jgi:hypothetical protein
MWLVLIQRLRRRCFFGTQSSAFGVALLGIPTFPWVVGPGVKVGIPALGG